jgi:hypothetical protein
MLQPIPRRTAGIPPLIERNTTLLALSQSFMGASHTTRLELCKTLGVGFIGCRSPASVN